MPLDSWDLCHEECDLFHAATTSTPPSSCSTALLLLQLYLYRLHLFVHYLHLFYSFSAALHISMMRNKRNIKNLSSGNFFLCNLALICYDSSDRTTRNFKRLEA